MSAKRQSLLGKTSDRARNWFKRVRAQQTVSAALNNVDSAINWESQTEDLALRLLISDRYRPLLAGRDLESAFLDEAFRNIVAEAFAVGSVIATNAVVKFLALTPDQGAACNLGLRENGGSDIEIILSRQGVTGIKLDEAKLDFEHYVAKRYLHYMRAWNENAQALIDEAISALPEVKRSVVVDILTDVFEIVVEWRREQAQLLGLKAVSEATKSTFDEDAAVMALWLAQEYPEYSEEAVLRRVRESKGEWLRPEDISTAQDLVREFAAAESRILAAVDAGDISDDDLSRLQAESALLRMRIDAHIEGPFTRAELEAERRERLDELKRLRDQ